MGIRWIFRNIKNGIKQKIFNKLFSNKLKRKLKNNKHFNNNYTNYLVNKYAKKGVNGLYYSEKFMSMIDNPKYDWKVQEQMERENIRMGGKVFDNVKEYIELSKYYNK